jgi:hypothetical protein
MAKKICIRVELPGQCPVTLYQHGKANFSVVYGMQTRSGLNYGDAAQELGEAIMHAAACAGKLDNS